MYLQNKLVKFSSNILFEDAGWKEHRWLTRKPCVINLRELPAVDGKGKVLDFMYPTVHR